MKESDGWVDVIWPSFQCSPEERSTQTDSGLGPGTAAYYLSLELLLLVKGQASHL